VSREHQLTVEPDGLVTIAGGKLTTYRRMAAEVVEAAIRVWATRGGSVPSLHEPNTATHPLPGGQRWPGDAGLEAFIDATAAVASLPRDVAAELVRTYGGRAPEVARRVAEDASAGARLQPDRPEILAMVDWSVREELAYEVADVLIRRTQVFYRAKDQGLSAVDAVAARMATLLGWSDAEREASAAAYRAEVALHRDGWARPAEA
jgi:glycerol-3-phosphate dehydrogenase